MRGVYWANYFSNGLRHHLRGPLSEHRAALGHLTLRDDSACLQLTDDVLGTTATGFAARRQEVKRLLRRAWLPPTTLIPADIARLGGISYFLDKSQGLERQTFLDTWREESAHVLDTTPVQLRIVIRPELDGIRFVPTHATRGAASDERSELERWRQHLHAKRDLLAPLLDAAEPSAEAIRRAEEDIEVRRTPFGD
jgi:hypothetical protein